MPNRRGEVTETRVYQTGRVYLRGGPADDTFVRVSVNTVQYAHPTEAGHATYEDRGALTPGGERIFEYSSGVILP